jgi:hypothetical protein
MTHILIKRPNSASSQEVFTFLLFNEATVPAGGTLDSDVVNIEYIRGFISLQQTISGSGKLNWIYLVSNDGRTFLEPEDANNIIAKSQTAGNKFFTIPYIPVTKYLRIQAQETLGSNSPTVSVTLAVQ